MSIKIEKIVVGELKTNCYITYDENNNGFIIDPSFDIDKILNFINDKHLNIKYIFLTHGHFDHVYMVNELKERLGNETKIMINVNGKEVLEDDKQNLIKHFMNEEKKINIDKFLEDGEIVEWGTFKIKHIHIGGHTLDSACYYVKDCDVMFSGDTLFYESIGRTDLYNSNHEQQVTNIKEKLLTLSEKTKVYPGHGKETNIKNEKLNNLFLR